MAILNCRTELIRGRPASNIGMWLVLEETSFVRGMGAANLGSILETTVHLLIAFTDFINFAETS